MNISRRVRYSLLLIASLVALTFIALFSSSPSADANNKQVVAYFTQWGIYGRDYQVKDIETSGSADTITIINYAFANIVDGECIMTTQLGVMDAYADYQKSFSAEESVDGVADSWDSDLRGNFNQLKKLKAMHPGMKVMISVGGWTWSAGFSDAASTQEKREQVVASCIDIYINGNLPVADGAGGVGAAAGVFDGIDIDWEYPNNSGNGNPHGPEDVENFTLLLQEFRDQMDAIDEDLLLTVAVGAGIDKYDDLEMQEIGEILDYVNLMTYDFHGAWESTTNFQAALYGSPDDPSSYPASTYYGDHAVQDFIDGGVPASKLILGVPFYGRGWTGVTNVNNGLYQSASGAANGTYEDGYEDFKVLKDWNAPLYRDPITQQVWKFDGTTFWTYDDAQTIEEKMAYINTQGLGGAMVWSLDGDDSSGTLMNAVNTGLYNGVTPPTSVPATDVPATEIPATEIPGTTVPPTVVPTTPPTGSCTAAAWDSSAVYVGGNTVSYNGSEWTAKWWTTGETPGTTGDATVWENTGSCGTGTNPTEIPATEVPATTVPATEVPATTVPATEVPATTVPATEVPATEVPTGSCTATAWDSSAIYTGGDTVSHNGSEWNAKWWTTGDEPGTTGQYGVWAEVGDC